MTPTPRNPDHIENLQRMILDQNCMHPCWFGITIGKDTLDDVQQLFSENFDRELPRPEPSFFDEGYWTPGIIEPTGPPDLTEDGEILFEAGRIRLVFVVREDNLEIVAGGLNVELVSYSSYLDWSPYLIPNVLSSYGVPDEVTISPLDGANGYALNIRYLDRGLFFGYLLSYAEETSYFSPDGIPICNHFERLGLMQIWFQAEEVPDLETLRDWDHLRHRQPFSTSIEDLSDLSLEEFTSLFSEPDVCFTSLPYDEWK